MPKNNILMRKDENSENVEPKGRNKKGKKGKKKDEVEDIDLDEIIKANRQVSDKTQKEKQQVANCPHMANKEEHQFMCTTCRVICCEPCLRMNHHGEQHRWCELMPYEPSDSESTNIEPEEELTPVNIRGKRRLPGGYVSTRRLGSTRKKESCTCCHGSHKHDPKSLKRLVPIDSSRFNDELLTVDDSKSSDDSDSSKTTNTEEEQKTRKKKKRKKKSFLDQDPDDISTCPPQMTFTFANDETLRDIAREDQLMETMKIINKGEFRKLFREEEIILERMRSYAEHTKKMEDSQNLRIEDIETECVHCEEECKRWEIFKEDLDPEAILYLKENNFDIHSNEPNEISKYADLRIGEFVDDIDDEEYQSEEEYDALSDEFESDQGFTEAVREWLKLPPPTRLNSIEEAWTALTKMSATSILHRLAPTERKKFIDQAIFLIEKRELVDIDTDFSKSHGSKADAEFLKENPEYEDHEKAAELEKTCEKILSGIMQLKTRFQKIYKRIVIYRGGTTIVDIIHTKVDKIGEDIIQSIVNYNPDIHGEEPFFLTDEIQAALNFIQASKVSAELPNASILRKVLNTRLNNKLLRKLLVKQEKEKYLPKNWGNPDGTEKIKTDNEFIEEVKKEQDTSNSQVIITQVDDLMKMVELGSDIYPFIERQEIDPFGPKNCPLDIYSICPISPALTWMHKIGSESNMLVTVGGKVVRELDFQTSVECLTMNKERELLATDPLNKRLMKVTNIETITTIHKFEKYLPLGICCSREGNILVTLSETYYDYNVPFDKRRFVARVSETGEHLMEIEFYNQEKTERFFIVPRRVTENRNGDIIVVDKILKNEGRLQFFNKDGIVIKTFDGHRDIFERHFDPRDVACDYRHRLLVCDYTNNKIIIFQPNYDLFKVIASYEGGLRYPLCMGLDSSSRIWVGGKFEKVMVLSYDKEIDE
ncbi:uncharacterized protein LOC133186779 [Saccostrea echinata]|uniref:uncharacterized protein LOC133186779 n=1 Tax=Saccostrea echinata TaxID=191078 RepID=UPI002A7FEF5A|nr:uncharacterized protein LOC133186779 [Saccostrea echinata]